MACTTAPSDVAFTAISPAIGTPKLGYKRENMNAKANNKIDQIQKTAELVQAAQRGDRAALGDLFIQYEKTIYAIAFRRLGNPSEAQELVQEVFMRAMQKIDQLRVPAAFGGWIRQITVRMAINRISRRHAVFSMEPDYLEATLLGGDTPEHGLMASEKQTQVRDGMARLRDMDRDTLEAFYLHGHSLAEMSHHFEAPIGTIKRRLHIARKRLAEQVPELAAV